MWCLVQSWRRHEKAAERKMPVFHAKQKKMWCDKGCLPLADSNGDALDKWRSLKSTISNGTFQQLSQKLQHLWGPKNSKIKDTKNWKQYNLLSPNTFCVNTWIRVSTLFLHMYWTFKNITKGIWLLHQISKVYLYIDLFSFHGTTKKCLQNSNKKF